jgi:hypothetical protein
MRHSRADISNIKVSLDATRLSEKNNSKAEGNSKKIEALDEKVPTCSVALRAVFRYAD